MATTARPSLTSAGLPSLTTLHDVEPWPFFEQVRELGPVVWDEGLQAWLVTSHELLKEIARSHEVIWGSARSNELTGLPGPEQPALAGH